jgi:hypothetical protein
MEQLFHGRISHRELEYASSPFLYSPGVSARTQASEKAKEEVELPEARFVEAYPILEPFVYVAIEWMH